MDNEVAKPQTPTTAQPEKQIPKEPKAEKAEKEVQANCLGCNKPIKKLKRYYRDGKFYCNKKCWRKAVKPKKEEKK